MNVNAQAKLTDQVRMHWRAFLPLWFMPVTLILAGLGFILTNGNPLIPAGIIGFVTFPYWIVANRRASRVAMSGALSQWHCFALGILAPFIVWCGLVVLFTVVALTIVAFE
jgi:hypothetical protein